MDNFFVDIEVDKRFNVTATPIVHEVNNSVSVIICSVDQLLFEQVSQSISETIGVPFEIIRIENSGTQRGIGEAYNTGVLKARYPYVCFVHEDVLFRSGNWGLILTGFFTAHPLAGVVGIAGSRYKSLAPGSWASGLFDTDLVNVIQHEPRYHRVGRQLLNPEPGSSYGEVETLDGVFLFARKEVCIQHPFDQHTFRKFHCYDLDFSLQVRSNWKLYVTFEVLIEHFSSGSLNAEWVTESVALSRKWHNHLPVGNLPDEQKRAIEWRNRTIFFYRMNILGYSWKQVARYFFAFGYFSNFSFPANARFIIELLKLKLKRPAPPPTP